LSRASVRSPADARGNVKLLHAVTKETRQDTSPLRSEIAHRWGLHFL